MAAAYRFPKSSLITLGFALLVLVLLVGFTVLLLVVCCINPHRDSARIWNLFLVAAGSLGAGSLLGFIYGTFGADESARFGPVFNAVAAALGGATAIDLARNDSAVNRALQLLAIHCGLGDGAGALVAFVVIAFFAPGFMLFYICKALFLNLPIALINKRIAQRTLNRARDEVLPKPDPAAGGVTTPTPSPQVVKAARAVVKREGAGRVGTPEKIATDALAFAALGKNMNAERALRRALEQKPDDPRLSYELALLLLPEDSDRQREAIPLLEDVVKAPDPPPQAWKLLGYACLWDREKLQRSVEATQKYLTLSPNEPGALLNLACAYAQLAGLGDEAARPGFWEKALKTLQTLLTASPWLKARVEELKAEDFRFLKDDPNFTSLL
jgi:tetratricopeptide (TPR) repeat protein